MAVHIVQSPEWGEFKTQYGTKAVRVGEVQYTKHSIPFTANYYAYAPKVDPFKINWDGLIESLKENNCIAINFDVPNIVKGTPEANEAGNLLKERCVNSPKSVFAESNILLDLQKSEEDLMMDMHKKHRYNIRYAGRNGVVAEIAEKIEDFDEFYSLLNETAERQKYYIHPKIYYKKVWELLKPKGMCEILTARFDGAALASWMFFIYDGVLYYPYGGSSEEYKNLYASNLLAWEGIKMGKQRGCRTFDMWGAADDPEDQSDPWYGFTNFKMKFGGRHITYIDSHDLVVNEGFYNAFNLANTLRWKLLNILK